MSADNDVNGDVVGTTPGGAAKMTTLHFKKKGPQKQDSKGAASRLPLFCSKCRRELADLVVTAEELAGEGAGALVVLER